MVHRKHNFISIEDDPWESQIEDDGAHGSHVFECYAGVPTAIYKITNTTNGRVYIGRSIHPASRFREHQQRPNRRMAADVAH